MINSVSITTATVGTKKAFITGNFDDGVLVSNGVLTIDYNNLTAGQQTTFNNFINNLLKTDKNVSIINLPNNSNFGIDYITDAVTFVDSSFEYDYTLVSGTVQGYIDAFNQLIIDLLP